MKRLRRFLLCCAATVCLWGFHFSQAHALWQSPPTVGSGLGVQIKDGLAQDEDLARIRAAGFSFVRFSWGWGGIETSQGIYDWRDADALVARARRHGLKMVIPLMGGHALYDGEVAAPQPNTDHVATRPHAPAKAETVQAFARFAAQAALRYGSRDIVWELWNEPDLARFWPPRPQAEDFAVLAAITCKTMRSVAPHAVIVGPALGRVPDARDGVTTDFFETFLTSDAPRCLDAISVHPYRHGREEPEAVFGDYATLFGMMATQKTYLPLINTEWGYTTLQVTPDEQAAYALRARLTDMIWGIPLSVWYEWRDSRDDPRDPEGHFGLMTLDGAAKLSLSEVEKLWPLLQDYHLERQIQMTNPRDVVLLLRGADGARALVGWSLRTKSEARIRVTRDGETTESLLTSLPKLLAAGHRLDAAPQTEDEDNAP